MNDNKFTKIYFLKDIHRSFRRNPKKQLQVNIAKNKEYRSREEFIKMKLVLLKLEKKQTLLYLVKICLK